MDADLRRRLLTPKYLRRWQLLAPDRRRGRIVHSAVARSCIKESEGEVTPMTSTVAIEEVSGVIRGGLDARPQLARRRSSVAR